MGQSRVWQIGLVSLLVAGNVACSAVNDASRQAAVDAYRTAHPGAGNIEVQRFIQLADCDYVEVSGTDGVDHMTVSRESPRVLQTAGEGPEYFDGDYGKDALNVHCASR